MYKSLSKEEKQYFLDQITVHLELLAEKLVLKKDSQFTIDIIKKDLLRESILQGEIVKYDDFLVIRGLKAVSYNPLSAYRGLYEVFCYAAIDRIKFFTKVYGQHHLRIYTSEDVIIEQLFDHGAALVKLAHVNKSEVMACMNV